MPDMTDGGIVLPNEMEYANEEIGRLRELILHCWVHSGYPDCGFMEMDTPMKELYISIVDPGELVENRIESHILNERMRTHLKVMKMMRNAEESD